MTEKMSRSNCTVVTSLIPRRKGYGGTLSWAQVGQTPGTGRRVHFPLFDMAI